jgi:hypothetical protein
MMKEKRKEKAHSAAKIRKKRHLLESIWHFVAFLDRVKRGLFGELLYGANSMNFELFEVPKPKGFENLSIFAGRKEANTFPLFQVW